MQKLFEHSDFILINKPAGMDFHGDDGVVATLREQEGEVFGVHRLDKDTSGVMVLAKTKNAQNELSKLFQNRNVTKIYLALSDRKPKKKMGKIKGDLEKGRGGSYYLKTSMDNPSETDFISSFCETEMLRYFILKPKTGKTHQLRVVMKSLGSPILGDKRYGGHESDRMYLHATYLAFYYKDEEFSFVCYPEDEKFRSIKKDISELWDSGMAQKMLDVKNVI